MKYEKAEKMNWNYRIIRHSARVGHYYALHEVFYDKNDKPNSMTAEPIEFVGDTPREIIDSLQQALQDVLKTRVLDEDRLSEQD